MRQAIFSDWLEAEDICKVIEQKCINLIAICAIDTVDEAVLRIVPEDHQKTKDALTALSMHVIETEILAVEIPNIPGATGKIASLLAEAGINKSLSIHSLRHTFASTLYEKSNNLLAVQQALGHRSITSTMIYTHLNPEQLIDSLEAM